MGGCTAVNCSNSSNSKNPLKKKRVFKFPSEVKRRQIWIERSGRDPCAIGNGAALCEDHFEPDQFEQHRLDGWKKLKPSAVPTIFKIPNFSKRQTARKSLRGSGLSKPCTPGFIVYNTRQKSSYNKGIQETNPAVCMQNNDQLDETYLKEEALNSSLYVKLESVDHHVTSTDRAKTFLMKTKCLLCDSEKKPLFRFPDGLDDLFSFLKLIHKEDLLRKHSAEYICNNGRLCRSHFKEEMYNGSLRYKLKAFDSKPSSLSEDVTFTPVVHAVKSQLEVSFPNHHNICIKQEKNVLKETKCLLCGSEKNPLFLFPENEERLSMWLKILHKEDLLQTHSAEYIQSNGRLCASHFKEEVFDGSQDLKLMEFALPFYSSSSLVNPSSLQDIALPPALDVNSDLQTIPTDHQSNCTGEGKFVLKKTRCLLCESEEKPLFSFPVSNDRLTSWLKLIHKEELLRIHPHQYIRNNARLCGLHFQEDSFTSSLRLKLNRFAVPEAWDSTNIVLSRFQNSIHPQVVNITPELNSTDHSAISEHNDKSILDKKKCLLCDSEDEMLFTFPKDPEHLSMWLKIIHREDLLHTHSTEYIQSNGRLCSSHFREETANGSSGVKVMKFVMSVDSNSSSVMPSSTQQTSLSPKVHFLGNLETSDENSKIVLQKTKCLLCNSEETPLFAFPLDEERLTAWLKRIHKEDLLKIHSIEYIHNNARLCGAHFKDNSFKSSMRPKPIRFALPFA